MLRRLYNWTMSLSAHRHSIWVLAAVAFIESSIFPIPPDILIIPMVLAARQRAWVIAFVCTSASVLGGIAGYGIGYFLFEQIGQPMLEIYGYQDKFDVFKNYYNDWGAWAVFIAGATPFPYKVITILSGVAALGLPVFIIASILARGLRFFIVAGLLWRFGDPIRAYIEKYLNILAIAFCLLLVGGFVLIKFLL